LKGFITRHQAGLFFPLLTLLGIDLKVSSVKALHNGTVKRRGLEGGLLVLHAAVYLSALLIVLSPLQAVAFFLVHQALFGVYLGMTFAPNHKGMPHPTGTEDFLRKQVVTSRNVRGGWLVNTALGGLNYQIEHHLFPGMPSPNLSKAQPIVQAYCAEVSVPYEQAGLIESYRQALRHLHEVGAPARAEHAAR
jgi:fatty acid desaturase